MQQGKKWIKAAGGVVVAEGQDDGVEVSPLISYVSRLQKLETDISIHTVSNMVQGGEGLGFLKDRTIKAPAVIEKEE